LSTLGKILTVLVALVSVVLAALVVRDFVLSNNWKANYDAQVKLFNEALEQRDKAIQQRDQDRVGRETEKAGLDERINTLTDELNLRNGTIRDLTAQRENQEKRLQELTTQMAGLDTSFKTLMAERDSWRKERDTAMKRADDLTTMYSELEAKYRNGQDDLTRTKEMLRQAHEEKVALESSLNWIAQNHPEVKLPAQVPAVPTATLNGLVVKADPEAKVAEVNLGSDDGVVKGMKFYIYNATEMKYLATLTITMVAADNAAGELSVIRGTVKANDHVTNRFEQ